MRSWLITLLVVLACGLLACGGGDREGENKSAPRSMGHITPALAESAWILDAFGNNEEPDTTATQGKPIRLEFGAEQQANGHSGCNRFFGGYEGGQNGILSFGEMGATRMACPPPIMERETRFFAALKQVAGYRIANEKLELLSSAGDVLLVFRPDNET